MKNYILMLLVFFIFSSLNAYSSSEVFESLEVDNYGVPTGNTIILTLEWISTDTLMVSVSSRTSISSDNVYCYNETTYPFINNSIACGSNTKFIPFHDVSATGGVNNCKFDCCCEPGVIDTGCTVAYSNGEIHCFTNGDPSCNEETHYCHLFNKIYDGGSSPVYAGYGGILIDANYVVFN